MVDKLSFGYLYDFRNPQAWRRDPAELYAETLDTIAQTEKLGFGSAWVPEHHLADDDYQPSPLVALAAIAARTSTMTIGSAIALGPLYEPLRFAEDCAVLDTFAGGRLELGLAIGYRRREYDAHGLDFTKRGQRFDEFLQIVKALWAGESVTHEGQHFTLKGATCRPLPPGGHVPLFIGGFAKKALERVARLGDGYYGNPECYDAYVAELEAQGKEPASASILIPSLFVAVARDPEAALDELAPHYHHVNNSYGEWMNEDKAIGLDGAAIEPMSLDAFKASGILQVWTPDKAIAKFREMQDQMNLKHYVMMMPPGLSQERFLAYASDFAQDVIPAFR